METAKPRSKVAAAVRCVLLGVRKTVVFSATFTLAGVCLGAGAYLGLNLAGWALQ